MASSLVSSLGSAHDPIERAGELAAQRIRKLLEEGRHQTGLSRPAFFVQALRVWDALLRPLDLDEYLNTICVGIENAMPQITQAFQVLQMEALDHYLDVLGIVYMQASVRANAGEEYTPWSLVRLLVRLQMTHFVPPAPGEPPRTFYDPCCGSGTLLLGQMEYLHFYHPEVIDRHHARFFGQDVSYDAWLMARINLRIHLLGRFLRRGVAGSVSQVNQALDGELPTLESSFPTETPALSVMPTPDAPMALAQSEPPAGLGPLFGVQHAPSRERPEQLQLPGFLA